MRDLGDLGGSASKLGPNLDEDGALILNHSVMGMSWHFKKMTFGGRDIKEESSTIIQQGRMGNESQQNYEGKWNGQDLGTENGVWGVSQEETPSLSLVTGGSAEGVGRKDDRVTGRCPAGAGQLNPEVGAGFRNPGHTDG